MKGLYKVLVLGSMVAALTVTGYAKPGNGNGGGRNNGRGGHNKPPKPENPGNGHGNGHGKPGSGDITTSGSFAVGTVVTSDSRILDLTGDYLLSGTLTGSTTTGSIALSLVQDDRGRLATRSTITLNDGTTTDVVLSGHLQLTAQTHLRVQLEGSIGVNDGVSSYTEVKLRGYWNGTSFDTTVTITEDYGTPESFTTTLTPVNPARGFTIADGAAVSNGNGKAPARSTRTATLPWGTETVRAQQKNGKAGFTFMLHSGDFGVDLRGTASPYGVKLNRAKVHLGYGSLLLPTDSVEITESAPLVP